LDRRPKQMSGGEQQRVALGRAMIRRPSVFLMDEPLTNLDAQLRGDMRVEIKHLQRELNTTKVYVTHDQTEAMSLAKRIAVMNLGVLQQVGSPLDIYDHPATLFVAGFIGNPPMNFIDVALTDGAQPILKQTHDAFALPITTKSRDQIRATNSDPQVRFGIRSEDIQITPNVADGDMPAKISLREPLGDEIIYNVQVGNQELRVKSPPTLRLQIGDQVGLKFDQARSHVFDLKTEKAIF